MRRRALVEGLAPRVRDLFVGLHANLPAGIHYRSDIKAGFALATKVLGKVVERAENDGSRMK